VNLKQLFQDFIDKLPEDVKLAEDAIAPAESLARTVEQKGFEGAAAAAVAHSLPRPAAAPAPDVPLPSLVPAKSATPATSDTSSGAPSDASKPKSYGVGDFVTDPRNGKEGVIVEVVTTAEDNDRNGQPSGTVVNLPTPRYRIGHFAYVTDLIEL